MTLQIAAPFVLLASMVYLFLTEKLPVDLTAFLGLVVLVFAGYVTPSEAFLGLRSKGVWRAPLGGGLFAACALLDGRSHRSGSLVGGLFEGVRCEVA